MSRCISTAPKDGSTFIGFEKGYGWHECWWDSNHDSGSGGFRNPYHGWRPTHWEPMPDEPDEQQRQSRMAKKGFVVVDSCEDWEQILCLETGDNLPHEGILTWPNEGFDRYIFPDRKSARSAIERTHHYAKAFGYTSMPERNNCKVQPVLLPELKE